MKFIVKSNMKKKASEPIKIYITNLGKYNEGELVGKWVELPVDDFAPILKEIGINEQYEEWFITDYEAPFTIGEYDNIEELNQLAKDCADFSDVEWMAFSEFLDNGESKEEAAQSVQDGDYTFIEGHTDRDLGVNYIYDLLGGPEQLDKETLERYFDYDAFGRDLRMDGFRQVDDGYISIH